MVKFLRWLFRRLILSALLLLVLLPGAFRVTSSQGLAGGVYLRVVFFFPPSLAREGC